MINASAIASAQGPNMLLRQALLQQLHPRVVPARHGCRKRTRGFRSSDIWHTAASAAWYCTRKAQATTDVPQAQASKSTTPDEELTVASTALTG
jgi:hypothetical protein